MEYYILPVSVPDQGTPVSAIWNIKKWVARLSLRFLLNLHCITLRFLRGIGGGAVEESPSQEPKSILLTGTFSSENWIMNHLRPLAESRQSSKIWVVCFCPIPATPKVQWICPPGWLSRLIGKTPARLAVFSWMAVRGRPDVIGGFHLLVNGLLASWLAHLVSSKSLYFCGGGIREVLGGGYLGNDVFAALGEPDPVLERKLIRSLDHFDRIICMGPRVVDYFKKEGVKSSYEVVPGGIDSTRYEIAAAPKRYDLILVGRLVEVKRVDLLLQAVALLSQEMPSLSVAVVGSGLLEQHLKTMAQKLAISRFVTFAGYQRDVVSWLKQSRIFVLTSDSEGLPLAVMEAMTCGLPCVVSDVGELGEIVNHGVNGFLVRERNPQAFADILKLLLLDSSKQERMSQAARQTAYGFELDATSKKWDKILATL